MRVAFVVLLLAIGATPAFATRIIYMNRHGGVFVPAAPRDDSRINHASVLRAPVSIAPFPHSEQTWQEIMRCTRGLFSRYDVQITDVDPGALPHTEAVIGGTGAAAGYMGAAGIAPHTCAGIVENAIVFAFAETIGDDALFTCETIAQELAHSFTLDHLLDCRDPMTYLDACGPKQFLDEEVACGETQPRDCWCGGTTVNSHRTLLALLGARPDNDPPEDDAGGKADDGGIHDESGEPAVGCATSRGATAPSVLALLALVLVRRRR